MVDAPVHQTVAGARSVSDPDNHVGGFGQRKMKQPIIGSRDRSAKISLPASRHQHIGLFE
jgi:hypothetical protein